MMEDHYHFSDEAFVRELELCRLDPKLFTHEAHLRLAWIHLQNSDVDNAIGRVENQLVNFVRSLGAFEKYNKTLTHAAVRTVCHFMKKSGSTDFIGFMNEFPRLKTHFRELIGTHYSVDVFSSEEAKVQCLEPDLLPYD